ncbi:hypothetical protein O181_016749 [Austropuccinia psidii MF-1]|uniref:Uncharacterized protein n=1 Tax=Austropuccinia psidii MF-1 TaxID=1389203 RepID=A0A9Q3C4I1_9BASI|nr:hypothetical protein [Austropuccinia psidii MF-1]
MNYSKAKVNFDTGAFGTCIGKDYLQLILPEWKTHPFPVEGVQCSSSSNNMYTLGTLDTNIEFSHPAGSVRIKKEIVVMDNCTSQNIIFGDYYLNIHDIEINNHKDRYFPIGENSKQKFAFYNMCKQITLVSSNIDSYREEFVTDQLLEAQINQSLSPKMRHDLIDVL